MSEYTVNLPPDQIAGLIQQKHKKTKFDGKKIKVRGSFWNTVDLKVKSAPSPTVLKSGWAMSGAMWAIFAVLLIVGFLVSWPILIGALALGLVHYLMTSGAADDMIAWVRSAAAPGPVGSPQQPPQQPMPPQTAPPQY